MSTPKPESRLSTALSAVPSRFRTRMVAAYQETKRRVRQARFTDGYDAAGLSTGKFCEVVLRYLQETLTGACIPLGKHISNFHLECQKLGQLPASAGLESLRVIIPRALIFLYTMRGKRGIGHVGGDVEANAVDLAAIVRVCDWIMAELIRINHRLPLEEAQALIDSIATKDLPDVWQIAGKKRILRSGLTHKDKVLLLLYSEPESAALAEDLFAWTEHSGMPAFRRDVLKPLHKLKLIEYDQDEEIVFLSPIGVGRVETELIMGS